MIPEAWESSQLILYKAERFPFKWKRHKILLKLDYADPQIFYYRNMWYIFLTNDPLSNTSMSIYFSKYLTGPWMPHALNPVIVNDSVSSRSAGRLFIENGQIFRFTQDCTNFYGERIYVQRTIELTPTEFSEQPHGFIRHEKQHWNQTAIHHIDLFKRGNKLLAIFDGYTARD
jgi:hypothetical protein